MNIQMMLNFRTAIFSELTNYEDQFYNHEDFISEKPNNISLYLETLIQLTPNVNTNRHNTSIDKAKQITMSYSINGSKRIEHANIASKIKNLRRGYGVCSDHSEIFLALSHVYGLKSREVHNTEHTFNEFYSKELEKWVWIDTQFGLLAKQDNKYLNLLDMKKLYDKNIIPYFQFFGDSNFSAYNRKPETIKFYNSKEDFRTIMLTKGNNVFEVENYSNNLSLLPKSLKQFFLLLSNIQPSYQIFYSYENDRINELKKITNYFYGFVFIWLFSNILIIFREKKK